MDDIRIRCPKCEWEPDGRPHWMCSCGCQWNTFDTIGRCPSCGKQWEHTQCIDSAGGCSQWSPHLDWYENLDNIIEEVREVIHQPAEA